MLSEIYELYKLYQIYKKLDEFKNPVNYASSKNNDTALESKCKEIKRMVLEGGFIYIKFAQWIISRLRSEQSRRIQYLVEYFDDIFDNCPYHSQEETERIFRVEFGREINDVIVPETLQPIASGSVGQVYRAMLQVPVYKCPACNDRVKATHTGQCPACYGDLNEITDVAIKIKHPEVDRQVRVKSRLFSLITQAQKIKLLKDWLALHIDINDFVANLTMQADFTNEAANNQVFRRNFRGNPLIYFPLVIESNTGALITEFVDGQTLDDIQDFTQLKCCLNYGAMVYQMVLVDNFCHGDLHHKNWKIRQISGTGTAADGDYQLVVYDYGICFATRDIQFNRDLIKAFKTFDTDILLDNLDGLIDGVYDDQVAGFAREIILKFKEDSIDMVHLLNRFNAMLSRYNCRLTTDSLNIVILLSLIDTTLRKQNLVGGHSVPGIVGDLLPSSNVRAKDLDVIAYARSRNAYPGLTEYLGHEQRIRRENSRVLLFGVTECNGMVFDPPE
jgi:predicted unusual protein kinase regulating ubiquinone biosynthesis (AarF/ABC1/UbiB family)